MWAKFDDGLIDHPKIAIAADAIGGKNARALVIGYFVGAVVWSNKHLTDGFVPDALLKGLLSVRDSAPLVRALVKARLFEPAEGGFRIHDFHDYNPSAETVRGNREWDRKRKELYADQELIGAIRERDRNRCRYCGQLVNWKDRRGPLGGQYDHVIPRGPNTLENVVTCCRACNNKKKNRTPEEAGMRLLPPGLSGRGPGLELVQS